METVIVQTGGIHQKYNFSEVAGDSRLTVGRAFSNDIIIADPYIGASQLVINLSPDSDFCWRINNVDSTNPVLLNKKVIESATFDLKSGDKITIGRTSLIFYAEDHDIPQAKAFSFSNWLHNHKFKPLFASVMLLALFAITLWMSYLETSTKLKWGELTVIAASPVILSLVWAFLWSIAGRFNKSDGYFFSHLFFTAFSFSLLIILAHVYSYFDYMFSSVLVGEIVDWLLLIVICGLLIGFNLNLMTYRPSSFIKGMVTSVSVFSVLAALFYLYEDDYSNTPVHTSTIMPSYIPSPSPVSVEEYVENYDVLFEKLSASRY